jgi:hypothetical protein
MTSGRTARVAQHIADPQKIFDTVQFIPCVADVARAVERALISLLRPPLNRKLPIPTHAQPSSKEEARPAQRANTASLTRFERDTNRMLGKNRAAEYCDVPVRYITDAVRSNDLKAAVKGGRGAVYVFAVSEVDRWRASFVAQNSIPDEPC